MPTKVPILTALTFAILAIFSFSHCVEGQCEFGIIRIKQSNWEIVELDNSGNEIHVEYNHVVSKESFGLRVQYEMPGHADECPDDYYQISDTIGSILIYSKQDFDSTHVAGASLNDYFLVRQLSPGTTLPYYEPTLESTKVFNKYNFSTQGAVDFILAHPPAHPGEYQFIIKLNGSISMSSRLMTLK